MDERRQHYSRHFNSEASERILSELNSEQAAAAAYMNGYALVIAGAGSGKTRTLVHRIAHLVEAHHVSPNQILAITFTNKAASEIRERAGRMLLGADELWMATFHSACLRMLRSYGGHVGLDKNFTIYDEDAQKDILRTVLGSNDDWTVGGNQGQKIIRQILKLIDHLKNNLLPYEEVLKTNYPVGSLTPEDVYNIIMRYEGIKMRQNALDYNDMILRATELLRDHPEVRERVAQRARYIHIDEYQDTNKAQYELVRQLASVHNNLLVVGDPDQSIYRFRGANIEHIIGFENDFPGVTTYRLEQNYRSRPQILEAANALIEHNKGRLEKTLRPTRPNGMKVGLFNAANALDEAQWVVERVIEERKAGRRLEEMAILYRTNALSRNFETALLRYGVPYKVIGGLSFYRRKEVRDMLAFAGIIVNPWDTVAFNRASGVVKCGIGDKTLYKIAAWGAEKEIDLIEACFQAEEYMGGGAGSVIKFGQLLRQLQESLPELTLAEMFRAIYVESGYERELRAQADQGDDEAKGRIENVSELVNAAQDWQSQQRGGEATLYGFLTEVALAAGGDDLRVQAENEASTEPPLSLMTLHACKGLEFEVVFLVGAEEKILPHGLSIGEPDGIEEERRLCYVGVTRAMDKLFITSSQERMSFGKPETYYRSRFLEEMADHLQHLDAFGKPCDPDATERRLTNGSNRSLGAGSPRRGTDHGYKERTRPAARPPLWPVASKPLPKSPAQPAPFKGGERVMHPKFGEGVVLACSGSGDKATASVSFGGEIKRLLVSKSNLTVIP